MRKYEVAIIYDEQLKVVGCAKVKMVDQKEFDELLTISFNKDKEKQEVITKLNKSISKLEEQISDLRHEIAVLKGEDE